MEPLAWARRAAILVAVIGIAMAVPAISSAVMDSRLLAIAREGAQIIVRVMVVFYLSQEPVKDWFAGRNSILPHIVRLSLRPALRIFVAIEN